MPSLEHVGHIFQGRYKAIGAYRKFVSEGRGLASPWGSLKNQIYLGDDAFVGDMQKKLSPKASLSEIPSGQKRPIPKPLLHYQQRCADRNEAIVSANQSLTILTQSSRCCFDCSYLYLRPPLRMRAPERR